MQGYDSKTARERRALVRRLISRADDSKIDKIEIGVLLRMSHGVSEAKARAEETRWIDNPPDPAVTALALLGVM